MFVAPKGRTMEDFEKEIQARGLRVGDVKASSAAQAPWMMSMRAERDRCKLATGGARVVMKKWGHF